MSATRYRIGAVLLALAGCSHDALPRAADAELASAPVDQGGPDAPLPFPVPLEGIWLVGWTGHVNHYSWVRFTVAGRVQGRADFLSGKDLPINGPFWSCDGQGDWTITQKADTVQLRFPAACKLADAAFTFSGFAPAGAYPLGAILDATVSGQGGSYQGFKFPPAQCDAAMTICTNPL